jgi:hypothetical protein
LPKRNQWCFFFGVAEGVSTRGTGVEGAGDCVAEADGAALSSGFSVAVCIGVGLGCIGFRGVASGEGGTKGCLVGDGAGSGVGLGVGVGVGTISICWRLFRKRSRSRFSSSDCWETACIDPRLNQMVSAINGIFNVQRSENALRKLKTTNLCSFKLSRRS